MGSNSWRNRAAHHETLVPLGEQGQANQAGDRQCCGQPQGLVMKKGKLFFVPVLTVGLMSLDGCVAILHHFEPQFLNTGPNGGKTPQTVGLAYERLSIPSGPRQLDGYLVRAQSPGEKPMAILIFHGVRETISDWVTTQRVLHDHGVSSMVFDYSGHGSSSKPGTFQNLNEDCVAAYSFFAARFPRGTRLCILGHSM